ncbi:MAG: type II toxin-antitoxin system prevent-host-death family antitoxin [Planctomycetota bacterium]
MTRVEMKEAKASVAEYVSRSRKSPVVFTRQGKPVAALLDIHNTDWETISLSLNPEFMSIVEGSRRRHKREGGIFARDMRQKLGIKR